MHFAFLWFILLQAPFLLIMYIPRGKDTTSYRTWTSLDDPSYKQIVIILLQFLLFAANLNIDIGEDNYEVVSGNAISGTFTVEKELSTDLWVVLTPSPGFEEDIQVFEITSPSGKNFSRLKN